MCAGSWHPVPNPAWSECRKHLACIWKSALLAIFLIAGTLARSIRVTSTACLSCDDHGSCEQCIPISCVLHSRIRRPAFCLVHSWARIRKLRTRLPGGCFVLCVCVCAVESILSGCPSEHACRCHNMTPGYTNLFCAQTSGSRTKLLHSAQ